MDVGLDPVWPGLGTCGVPNMDTRSVQTVIDLRWSFVIEPMKWDAVAVEVVTP